MLLKIGKIYKYNGENGYILTDNYEYPFSKKDVKYDAKNGDIVTFIPNLFIFGEEKSYVARFIKKYENEKELIMFKENDE